MAGYVYKQRIGGEWRDAADGRVANVVNPATEEVVRPLPFGGAADGRAAIDAAAAAFPAWAGRTPYERGAVRPSQQGLGLGLYIASEIARAHGGTLTVSSTVEETCFTLKMPT